MAEHSASCPVAFGGSCDCDFNLREAAEKLQTASELLLQCCPRCEQLEAAIQSALDDLSRRSGVEDAVYTLTLALKSPRV